MMSQNEYDSKSPDPPPYTSGNPPPQAVSYVQPGQVYHANMVVPTVIPVVMTKPMGPKPTPYTCVSCNQQIVTRVESHSTVKTHLFAALLCIIGCWPCVCIPYCVDSCRNANHYCPNCNAFIGSYNN